MCQGIAPCCIFDWNENEAVRELAMVCSMDCTVVHQLSVDKDSIKQF